MPNKHDGIHVGRPHVSDSDPKTHVTITQRDGQTGHVIDRRHSSTIGAIAIGSANFLGEKK